MTRCASAKQLVGRRIVAFDARPFQDGRGGTAHWPIIWLDDGSFLSFEVEETDTGDYGIRVEKRWLRQEK